MQKTQNTNIENLARFKILNLVGAFATKNHDFFLFEIIDLIKIRKIKKEKKEEGESIIVKNTTGFCIC